MSGPYAFFFSTSVSAPGTPGATTNCRDFDGETCVAYVRRWMARPEMLAEVDHQHLEDLAGMLVELQAPPWAFPRPTQRR